MEGYWKGASKKASVEVEVTARAIRQMLAVKSLVERCGRAVGWQRLLCRLKLLSVPEGEARKICQPMRRAFLQKMGLPPGPQQQQLTCMYGWLNRMSLQWRCSLGRPHRGVDDPGN